MTASNVAIISACIAFTGLMVTLVTKLMSVSVKYGEVVKQIDMVQSACKRDVKSLEIRVTDLEKDMTSTAVFIARLDENMQTIVRQNEKLEAKLDSICDKIANK
ncbi:MAG: hypothetical protein MJZ25_13070 [Fibrobacter sp.]|nr:hypothetical protein [Fibrobacter sp.]